MIGLGDKNAHLIVYIENKPPLDFYQNLNEIKAMKKGEIKLIGDQTGNHWRKIFNVFAKLYFEINSHNYNRWQTLRDEFLLQQNSSLLLAFSPPIFSQNAFSTKDKLTKEFTAQFTQQLTQQAKTTEPTIHLIMGKGYASKLALEDKVFWLNEYFAINEAKKLIICPYFDYRQLSNIKITQLCCWITNMQKQK